MESVTEKVTGDAQRGACVDVLSWCSVNEGSFWKQEREPWGRVCITVNQSANLSLKIYEISDYANLAAYDVLLFCRVGDLLMLSPSPLIDRKRPLAMIGHVTNVSFKK